MADLARAAGAALDVNLRLFSSGWTSARNAESLLAIEDALVESLGVSRTAAVRALHEAVARRARALR
jgi:hypothetical protein